MHNFSQYIKYYVRLSKVRKQSKNANNFSLSREKNILSPFLRGLYHCIYNHVILI